MESHGCYQRPRMKRRGEGGLGARAATRGDGSIVNGARRRASFGLPDDLARHGPSRRSVRLPHPWSLVTSVGLIFSRGRRFGSMLRSSLLFVAQPDEPTVLRARAGGAHLPSDALPGRAGAARLASILRVPVDEGAVERLSYSQSANRGWSPDSLWTFRTRCAIRAYVDRPHGFAREWRLNTGETT